ncbi:MAG: hypothetical protein ACRELU_06380 [Gemmatimonadota bacterium]
MRRTAATLAILGLGLFSAALPCFAAAFVAQPERAAPMADCEDPGQPNHAAFCAEPGFAAPLAGVPQKLPDPPVIGAVPAAGSALALSETPQRRFLASDLSPPRAATPAFLLHSAFLI